MRLKLSDQAQADLMNIAEYIARRSKNRVIGRNFTKKIIEKCKELASIKGTMGIARPDLGDGIRSHPFGNYVLIFMYEEDCFHVVTIIEGIGIFKLYFRMMQCYVRIRKSPSLRYDG